MPVEKLHSLDSQRRNEIIYTQYVRHCDCLKMNNVFNLIHNERMCVYVYNCAIFLYTDLCWALDIFSCCRITVLNMYIVFFLLVSFSLKRTARAYTLLLSFRNILTNQLQYIYDLEWKPIEAIWWIITCAVDELCNIRHKRSHAEKLHNHDENTWAHFTIKCVCVCVVFSYFHFSVLFNV